MRLSVSRRHRLAPSAGAHVVEIVSPRTNAAALTSAENFFTSVALSEPFSLDLASDCNRRQFLVRAASAPVRDQVLSQVSAAYPQADFRRLSAEQDPAEPREGEQVAACSLGLRGPAYLPLRTFTDLDVDGERAAQADPLLGILSALGDLPNGWRGLSQLVLPPAEENWCRDYQRLSVQHPLEHERVSRPTESAGPMILFMAALLGTLIVGLQAYLLARAAQWTELTLLMCASSCALIGMLWLARPSDAANDLRHGVGARKTDSCRLPRGNTSHHLRTRQCLARVGQVAAGTGGDSVSSLQPRRGQRVCSFSDSMAALQRPSKISSCSRIGSRFFFRSFSTRSMRRSI